jgi:glycogen synthase
MSGGGDDLSRAARNFFQKIGVNSKVARVTKGTEKVPIIGEGTKNVLGVSKKLKKQEVDVEVFTPSLEAWTDYYQKTDFGKLTLSDDKLKSLKIFEENRRWIQEIKEKGYTLLDIGHDGRPNPSVHYQMEKEEFYGN